jgi:CubicO group peptidase (beta-lactamase class C family)
VGGFFLDGQGWGFGGGVDTELISPWNVVGRYGWVGGTGTSAYVHPDNGTVAVLLSQVGLADPVVAMLESFWTVSAEA